MLRVLHDNNNNKNIIIKKKNVEKINDMILCCYDGKIYCLWEFQVFRLFTQ